MPSKIQLRRDTGTNWFSVNPVLSDGELGFETDTLKFKLGDGTTNWNGLAYVINPVDLSAYALLTDIPDVSGFATTADLTDYALTADLPDVSGYVEKTAAQQTITGDIDITGALDVSGTLEGGFIQIPGWIQTITNPTNVLSFQKPVEFVGFKESIFDMGTIGSTGWQPQPELASVFKSVFNGDVEFLGFVQAVEGQTLTLIITQDGAGSRLLTMGTGITAKFAGGEATLSTDAGAVDIVNIFYDGACYYISITKGYE